MSEITEPIAYLLRSNLTSEQTIVFPRDINLYKGHYDDAVALYSKAQLKSHVVRMTTDEYKEWLSVVGDNKNNGHFGMTYELFKKVSLEHNKYPLLSQRLFKNNDFTNSQNEAELAYLYSVYDPENPRENIDLVPVTKWFVVSTNSSGSKYNYLKIFKNDPVVSVQTVKRQSYATPFDSYDEALEYSLKGYAPKELPIE